MTMKTEKLDEDKKRTKDAKGDCFEEGAVSSINVPAAAYGIYIHED